MIERWIHLKKGRPNRPLFVNVWGFLRGNMLNKDPCFENSDFLKYKLFEQREFKRINMFKPVYGQVANPM